MPENCYYLIASEESNIIEFVHPDIEKVIGIKKENIETFNCVLELYPENERLNLLKKCSAAKEIFKMQKETSAEVEFFVQFKPRINTNEGKEKPLLHRISYFIDQDDDCLKLILHRTEISESNQKHSIKKAISNIDINSQNNNSENNHFNFTSKEIEIIKLMTKGYNTNEIAEELFISPLTVKTHKRNILQKSQTKNSLQLVATCIRKGIV
ncbi:helix-turn-helix transcriptional regulator [Flammeovirgaceae bacterium KN852]|uniref:Helix-turn-helix transcriptional regulator n=2 Tax=Marinigracilibium pacificum TaxID=2729599 RepID=A0A848J1S6_9BACT|nr:helix-turn-helix transcriptional regulator [Marinigracilibium pacificum]